MSLHPAYFTTRFRVAQAPPEWPSAFIIVTAYATTGERWTDDESARADEALRTRISQLAVWHWPVTGYDPTTGHAEPGWAIGLDRDDGVRLGIEFRQDAIFCVTDDVLEVVSCRTGEVSRVGAFRIRLGE